ncbi:MAG: cytochrome c oxidase assembly protein [Herbaspirillum sp.]|jgi:cytochrome c oxidase assembly protein subunit 11|nr:cytochrome c oxidase assembly protein [Herbaspirillum sp.]
MSTDNPESKRAQAQTLRQRLNGQMFKKLLVIAAVMFGFGYALVPVYKQICQLTGVNFLTPKDGTVVAPMNSQIDKTRTITVEFDSNSKGTLRFRPIVGSLQVHPGEMATVMYEVVNAKPVTINAQAIPSYAPEASGQFFKKVECFCFTQQTLKAHEARQMPVVFFVDPALPKEITTITLSYTFFEIDGSKV